MDRKKRADTSYDSEIDSEYWKWKWAKHLVLNDS